MSEENKSQDPVISVVILSCTKRDTLPQAVLSAKTQTLDNSLFEVIVVKNPNDTSEDSDLHAQGARVVRSEYGNVGSCLRAGIIASKGSIISILDDDDLFSQDKLEVVFEQFRKTPSLGYYHNSQHVIDDYGKGSDGTPYPELEEAMLIENDSQSYDWLANLFKFGPDFNSSSISFKKDVVLPYLDTLGKLLHLPDTFIFYVAILARHSLLLDTRKLTYYRIHESLSTVLGSFQYFLQRGAAMREDLISSYKCLTEVLRDSDLRKFAECAEIAWELQLAIVNPEIDRRTSLNKSVEFAKCIAVRRDFYPKALLLMGAFYTLFPRFIRRLYYLNRNRIQRKFDS